MNYKSFAERTKNKTFDELVHEGKRRAHELIEDQGIAAIDLYITAHEPEELLLSGEDALKDAEESEKRWREWEQKHQRKTIRIN